MTVTLSDIVPPAGFLHVSVYVLVAVSVPVDCEPASDLLPAQSADAVQEFVTTLDAFHVRFVDAPYAIDVENAVNETEG